MFYFAKCCICIYIGIHITIEIDSCIDIVICLKSTFFPTSPLSLTFAFAFTWTFSFALTFALTSTLSFPWHWRQQLPLSLDLSSGFCDIGLHCQQLWTWPWIWHCTEATYHICAGFSIVINILHMMGRFPLSFLWISLAVFWFPWGFLWISLAILWIASGIHLGCLLGNPWDVLWIPCGLMGIKTFAKGVLWASLELLWVSPPPASCKLASQLGVTWEVVCTFSMWKILGRWARGSGPGVEEFVGLAENMIFAKCFGNHLWAF